MLFRLAVGESVRFPQLAQVMVDRGPAVSYGRLRAFIAARVAAGEIQVEDAQIAAEQFLGGIIGHLQLRRALGQPPRAHPRSRLGSKRRARGRMGHAFAWQAYPSSQGLTTVMPVPVKSGLLRVASTAP